MYSPTRENLGNAYELQTLELHDIQAAHQAELYRSGIAARSLTKLSRTEADATTKADYRQITLAVYRHIMEYTDGRPDNHEYGVLFMVQRESGNAMFEPRYKKYYAPMATMDGGNVVACGAEQTAEALHDARTVYSMVHELLMAQANGSLPDLSADLIEIKDVTANYQPPTPLQP